MKDIPALIPGERLIGRGYAENPKSSDSDNTLKEKELYPFEIKNEIDYIDIVQSLGFDILLHMAIGMPDVEGDYIFCLCDDRYHNSGTNYGILTFGWASCSGCDALLACVNRFHLLNDLRTKLFNEIQWYENVDLCIESLKDEETWESKLHGRSPFRKICLTFLETLKEADKA
jgi:hypothetical protein